MSSIKIILFKGKTYADGTHPIMLQYYNNIGKIKRKVIYRCLAKDWDEKTSRIKGKTAAASAANSFISETFAEAERELFNIMKGEANGISFFDASVNMTVGEAIEKEMKRLTDVLKPTPYSQLKTYADQLGNLTEVPVSQANISWFNAVIDRFRKLGNSPSTLEKKVKHIRRVIAKYSESELSREVKSIRFSIPKPIKQKLTADELISIESFNLTDGSNKAISRDIFVLQVYLRGIRIGDILQARCGDFKDGRFKYAADKTGKEFTIGLIKKAQVIVDRYDHGQEYLFPLFDWRYNKNLSKFENEKNRLKCKEIATTLVNKNLKRLAKEIGITKPLSSHIARHTFARMAIDKINNPMITMDLLGHSSLAVHQAYLNDIRKDEVLDAAADSIFG